MLFNFFLARIHSLKLIQFSVFQPQYSFLYPQKLQHFFLKISNYLLFFFISHMNLHQPFDFQISCFIQIIKYKFLLYSLYK